MPRLSIVIPCVQDARRFETTLASVLQNRPQDCEVLVVQPRSYRDPYALRGEVRFLEAPPDSTAVDLVNLGVQMAESAVIHVLSCDVEVTDGWTEPALVHFNDPMICAVSPRLVDADSPHHVVALGVHYRVGGTRRVCIKTPSRWRSRRCPILGPTYHAGFYRREAILEVGGFRTSMGAQLFDVDMGLALQAAGGRAIREDESVVKSTSPARATRLSFLLGRHTERLFWHHAARFGWARSLLMHASTVIGELIVNVHRPAIVLQTLGRVATVLEFVSRRGRRGRTWVSPTGEEGDSVGLLPSATDANTDRKRPLSRRAAA